MLSKNDFLHYALVYGVLLVSWVPVMDALGGNLPLVAAVVFVLFVAADKFAHRMFRI